MKIQLSRTPAELLTIGDQHYMLTHAEALRLKNLLTIALQLDDQEQDVADRKDAQ